MSRRQHIEDLNDLSVPEQPALSPDGQEIVYVLRTSDAAADRNVTALWRVGSRDGDAERLTAGPADAAPAWSPDGSSVAFLRAADGPAQLWLFPARGGEPKSLTDLPLGAGRPVWSPDGSRIAFIAPVDLHATPGESVEDRERRGHDPLVTERLDYQADGVGIRRGLRMHVHVVEVETAQVRQVTSGDLDAGEPTWAPDGKELAFAAATARDRDLVFRAPLYRVAADGMSDPELVAFADSAALGARWTPDGTGILAVAMDPDKGFAAHAHLFSVPLDGGDPVDLAASLDRNVMPGGPGYPGALPQVTGDARDVVFCVRDRGCTHLYSVPLEGGEPRPLISEPGTVVSGASVGGSLVAVVMSTATSFGEVAVVDLAGNGVKIRTAHGPDPEEIELFTREEREFTISDGAVVQGWLVRDPDAPHPQPLLLDIHGGPHNAWNGAADTIHLYHQELAARGWAVLLLNPRGSDGYGEDFYRAALEDWGEADARDFLEPIDALVAEGLADPDRLAVTGYSYGGYMTCYLTSRDERFAAAVAGGVVSDLVSMGGTSDDAHLLSQYELGGAPWAARDRYEAMSPLSRVENVLTPTLVYHGEADRRCPVGQAQQWHTALRELGVPTTLVLYPDEGHLFILDGRPSHRRDFNRRVVDWVEQHAGRTGTRPLQPRLDEAHWQRRLAVLSERYRVPGAVLGILRVGDGADETCLAAYGVVNKETGVETTEDSVFQIGSMTKVWTATVVMQLVDEGKLDLDAPITEVLPELKLSDQDVAARVTMRHLLTHTSGIDGDVFTDTGRGDDCLEKYVALLAEAAQNHPLEATWSYCNSGFVLVGRVIEKLTDGTWDAAIKERLVGPLGMTHTGTLPEEALLHRAAVGHVSEDGSDPERAPAWGLPRALGPAGLVNSTPADVLAFARMHLTGGLAPDGSRILSESAVSAMAEHQVDLPDKYTLGDSWGLGWIRFGWDGRRLIGHDGNTIGQAAFLRVLPEEGLAVTLLTNGGNPRDLYEDLYREIFGELAGIEMPHPLTPPSEPVEVDVDPRLGTYERAGARLEVLAGAEGPVLRTTVTGPIAELVAEPTHEYPMVAVAENLFVVRDPDSRTWTAMTFYDLPSGESYLHFGVRATPRTN